MWIFQIRYQNKVIANQRKGGPFWPPLGKARVNVEDFISIANALIWRICFKILTVVISFFIQLSAEKYFETYHLDFCRWNWLFILNWIFWQEIRAYSFIIIAEKNWFRWPFLEVQFWFKTIYLPIFTFYFCFQKYMYIKRTFE